MRLLHAPLVVFACGALLLVAPAAHAQRPPDWGKPVDAPEPVPPGQPVASTAPAAREWYGWQPIVSDAATTVATAALSRLPNQSGPTLGTMFVGYALVPPIIHAAHGRLRVAALDLVLRASSVGVGFWAGGLVTASCGRDDPESGGGGCQLMGQLAGAGVGALAAMIVDAALLSWEPAAAPEPAPPTARGLTVSPSVVWTREHTGVGLHGTF